MAVNRRVSSEVLGITLYSHRDLEQLLRGFNAAYNARRQRILAGKTPNQVVAEHLQACHQLANVKTYDRAGPDDIAKARIIVEPAKEVSQPNMNKIASFLFDFAGRCSAAYTIPAHPNKGHHQDGNGQLSLSPHRGTKAQRDGLTRLAEPEPPRVEANEL